MVLPRRSLWARAPRAPAGGLEADRSRARAPPETRRPRPDAPHHASAFRPQRSLIGRDILACHRVSEQRLNYGARRNTIAGIFQGKSETNSRETPVPQRLLMFQCQNQQLSLVIHQ